MAGFPPSFRDQVFENALLDEARHRYANEFASAFASLSLVRASGRVDHPILDKAIERLDGNVRIERMLLNPRDPDIGNALLDLCSLIASSRVSHPTYHVKLIGRALAADLAQMRIFLMVAYELLGNAAKRSRHNSRISVRLSNRAGEIRLSVVNSFDPCEIIDICIPAGLRVLRRLVIPFGGRIHFKSEGSKYVAQARFPQTYRART